MSSIQNDNKKISLKISRKNKNPDISVEAKEQPKQMQNAKRTLRLPNHKVQDNKIDNMEKRTIKPPTHTDGELLSNLPDTDFENNLNKIFQTPNISKIQEIKHVQDTPEDVTNDNINNIDDLINISKINQKFDEINSITAKDMVNANSDFFQKPSIFKSNAIDISTVSDVDDSDITDVLVGQNNVQEIVRNDILDNIEERKISLQTSPDLNSSFFSSPSVFQKNNIDFSEINKSDVEPKKKDDESKNLEKVDNEIASVFSDNSNNYFENAAVEKNTNGTSAILPIEKVKKEMLTITSEKTNIVENADSNLGNNIFKSFSYNENEKNIFTEATKAITTPNISNIPSFQENTNTNYINTSYVDEDAKNINEIITPSIDKTILNERPTFVENDSLQNIEIPNTNNSLYDDDADIEFDTSFSEAAKSPVSTKVDAPKKKEPPKKEDTTKLPNLDEISIEDLDLSTIDLDSIDLNDLKEVKDIKKPKEEKAEAPKKEKDTKKAPEKESDKKAESAAKDDSKEPTEKRTLSMPTHKTEKKSSIDKTNENIFNRIASDVNIAEKISDGISNLDKDLQDELLAEFISEEDLEESAEEAKAPDIEKETPAENDEKDEKADEPLPNSEDENFYKIIESLSETITELESSISQEQSASQNAPSTESNEKSVNILINKDDIFSISIENEDYEIISDIINISVISQNINISTPKNNFFLRVGNNYIEIHREQDKTFTVQTNFEDIEFANVINNINFTKKQNMIELNIKESFKILSVDKKISLEIINTNIANIKGFTNQNTQEIPTVFTSAEQSNDSLYDNNTLTINEETQKVYLPYKIEDVLSVIKNDSNDYHTINEVVENVYTVPLAEFKVPIVSRFKESYRFMRKKEKSSVYAALDLALELMFNSNLHPAIIRACSNIRELNTYLDCLYENEIEKFDCFKIIYKVLPRIN